MIEHDVEQGSPAWHALRIGIPTTSEFDQIVTPTGKPSASAVKYMARLIAEHFLGESQAANLDNIENVANGKLLEPQAARMFEFEHDLETRVCGFITTDSGRWGASPDRLFEGGLLEIKAPTAATHCLYATEGFGPAYKVQVQGQLLVSELDRACRYSFHPRFQPVTLWTPRDEPFIATLRGELQRFSDTMERHIERLRASGFYTELAAKAPEYANDEDEMDRIAASMGAHNRMAG